jgi:hypothetical protein
MEVRCLILGRDESVTLSNKMQQEIVSAITRVHFHQKALAHIRIMNTKRDRKGAITAITHPNATAEMPLLSREIIITAPRMVDKEVVHVEQNEFWERLTIHAVHLWLHIGKGMEGLQKM